MQCALKVNFKTLFLLDVLREILSVLCVKIYPSIPPVPESTPPLPFYSYRFPHQDVQDKADRNYCDRSTKLFRHQFICQPIFCAQPTLCFARVPCRVRNKRVRAIQLVTLSTFILSTN